MPESVKRRGSSGPTTGATLRSVALSLSSMAMNGRLLAAFWRRGEDSPRAPIGKVSSQQPGRKGMWRVMFVAVAIAAAIGLAEPARASVPYDVWSCRLPDGSPAPTDGWTPRYLDAGTLTDTCTAATSTHSLAAAFN